MITCAIFGCNNSLNSDPNIHHYYFPKHPEIAQQWLNLCLWKAPLDINTARICSVHFGDDSYSMDYKMINFNGTYIKMLKHDAIPTMHLQQTIDKDMINAIQDPGYIYITPEYVKIDTTEHRHVNENAKLKNTITNKRHNLQLLSARLEAVEEEFRKTKEEYRQKVAFCNQLRRRNLNLSQQMKILNQVFSESQIKILMGKKKIYWSEDDMAVAYTIRHMSSKRCYMHLTKNLNIPLPALSSIKRWATVKKPQKGSEMVENDSD